VQRGEGPQVGLLDQVLGRARIAQRCAQPPDVGLGRAHERRRGERIARGGVGRQVRELVHVAHPPFLLERAAEAPRIV
jgi:hypothetical protein